jgi:hypothetical protein
VGLFERRPFVKIGNRAIRTAAAAAAVAGALVMAGCSSSGPSSSPAASSTPGASVAASASPTATTAAAKPNSCNVITQAEASQALGGQTVKPPVRGKATVEGGVACVYYGPSVPAGVSADVPVGDSVRVVLVTGPHAKKWFDNYRTKVHSQSIPGLGDEAYWDGYASVSVLKGSAYLRIAVGIANPEKAEEALATDALPRM